jgi:hypothetical protein
MEVEQIPHFFLENTRKSLIYQSLLMPTTSTEPILIHSSYPDAIGIHFYRILETALINSLIIY